MVAAMRTGGAAKWRGPLSTVTDDGPVPPMLLAKTTGASTPT